MIIDVVAEKLVANSSVIDDFLVDKIVQFTPYFTNSIDLRHNGFKIAPVDCNVFPAGFNNLASSSLLQASKKVEFSGKKILIIGENHTRNIAYFKNLLALRKILQEAGNEVKIANLLVEEKTFIDVDEKRQIEICAIVKKRGRILTDDGFNADLLVNNNDFSGGRPEVLTNIEQKITPPIEKGWFLRRKSAFFAAYEKLVDEICALIDLDPWLLKSYFLVEGGLDFKNSIGIENLAFACDALLNKVKEKYLQYDIKNDPYCFVKADSGTYGMGVMCVSDGDEILKINKKVRNKMNVVKGHLKNEQVLIQEGVVTSDLVEKKVCEPLIYLINGAVIGNLLRINDERGGKISLNHPGMSFADIENFSENNLNLGAKKAQFIKVYAFIAQICAIAAKMEEI